MFESGTNKCFYPKTKQKPKCSFCLQWFWKLSSSERLNPEICVRNKCRKLIFFLSSDPAFALVACWLVFSFGNFVVVLVHNGHIHCIVMNKMFASYPNGIRRNGGGKTASTVINIIAFDRAPGEKRYTRKMLLWDFSFCSLGDDKQRYESSLACTPLHHAESTWIHTPRYVTSEWPEY